MTAYISQLTLPESIFNNAPASIALPIALGTAVGYSTRRKLSLLYRKIFNKNNLTHNHPADDIEKDYYSMKQPPLRPPASVFGPVWTTLYGMMGYAAYRAVHYGTSPLNTAVSPPKFSLTHQTNTPPP